MATSLVYQELYLLTSFVMLPSHSQKSSKTLPNTTQPQGNPTQMIETTPAINTQNLTEEEYRKLCKQVRQYQLVKAKGKKRSKPILKPIGQTISIDKKLIIQQSPIDWDAITTGTPFSLDASGTLIYTKTGSGRALCLNTMSSVPVGGAAVYRIFL